MRRALLAAAVLFLLVSGASVAHAQLAANEVYVNQSFQVAMDHDGLNTTGYRLYRNNVIVSTVSTAARVNGVVTFPARTETTTGTVLYEATAINSDGTTTLESTRGAVTVTVKAALVQPNAPTLPRVVRLP
jgi:hypothetical protein